MVESHPREVRMEPTCPVPRCTQLQWHWGEGHVPHSLLCSWLSNVGIRGDREVLLWLCNLQAPGEDSKLSLKIKKRHAFKTSNLKKIRKLTTEVGGIPKLSIFNSRVFSSFCRSQDSSLSGKVRVKWDSLTKASLQPWLSFTTPQDSVTAPNPAT